MMLHMHMRSRCDRCGCRAFTPTVAERLAFLDRHKHTDSVWSPPEDDPPVRFHSWAITAMLTVAIVVVVVVEVVAS